MGKGSRFAAVLLSVAVMAGAAAGGSVAGAAPTAPAGARGAASAAPNAGLLNKPCPWTTPDAFRWIGPASGAWNVAANWSRGRVPGTAAGNTDRVCVTAGVTVQVNAGEAFDVQGFWIRGALRVLDNGVVLVHGDPATQASAVQSVTLNGGGLGGSGLITVYGQLVMSSSATAVATLSTRSPGPPRSTPPPRAGRLSLAVGSQLLITSPYRSCASPLCGGVRLRDGFILDDDGAVTITGTGYLLAEWGTQIRNDISGLIDIQNDFGIYQGAKPSWATTRSVLTNGGLIQRSSGAGTSVIDVHFVADGGSIATQAGTLSIFSDGFPAFVEDGTSIADGGCPDGQSICRTTTPQPVQPQLEVLQNETGQAATLAMQRLDRPASNPYPLYNRLIGVRPVSVRVVGSPTVSAPVRVLIGLDLSVVPSKNSDGSPITYTQLQVGLPGVGAIHNCKDLGPADRSVCVESRTLSGHVVTLSVRRAQPGSTILTPMGPRFR